MSLNADITEMGPSYYWGASAEPAYYLWDEKGTNYVWAFACSGHPIPWRRLSRLAPVDGIEGACVLRQRKGWTALGFTDYSRDRRRGAHSLFLFPATLSFEAAVTAAQERFPAFFERVNFELTHEETVYADA